MSQKKATRQSREGGTGESGTAGESGTEQGKAGQVRYWQCREFQHADGGKVVAPSGVAAAQSGNIVSRFPFPSVPAAQAGNIRPVRFPSLVCQYRTWPAFHPRVLSLSISDLSRFSLSISDLSRFCKEENDAQGVNIRAPVEPGWVGGDPFWAHVAQGAEQLAGLSSARGRQKVGGGDVRDAEVEHLGLAG
jgi:hypothetical protein